jgi:sulfatase maturation enzyme AslB (radical SAM superfamily)
MYALNKVKYFMDKIFWLQPEDSQLGKWQRQLEDVSKSHSFCVLPWIHLATRPNGDMRICCVANASGADTGDYTVGLVKMEDGKPANFAHNLPTEAFNNDYMKSVRKTMLEGKIPASCTKCFKEEQQGIASKRIWETGTWFKEGIDIPELIAQTKEDGSVPYKLQYLDLRLGHTCNLKCVMCSPHDSSMWVPEHKKVFPIFASPLIKKQMSWEQTEFNNTWHENPKFWEEVYDQIPNIKQLYFAGGEPLLIKEHRRFLEEIVARGYANKIILRYNTNGTLINQDIINLWSKFLKVKVGFSLDGMETRGHYIRYPLDWDTIVQNLHTLDNAPDNIQTNIALAVQILNIKHVPDFIKWKVKSNFKKINMDTNAAGQVMGGGLIGVHLLWIPTWLSLRVLPKEDKAEVRQLFADLQEWLWKNYTQDKEFWETNPYGWKRWEGILDWMDSEDQSNLLPDFKEYIMTMDQQRGLDFKSTFPELEHLL